MSEAAVSVRITTTELREFLSGKVSSAAKAALRKAGSTALRDMRSEASKRVRKRKRIRVSIVRRMLDVRAAGGSKVESMAWTLNVRGDFVPLSSFPHRQTRRGVSVATTPGQRKLVGGAFAAKMPRSGHEGIFVRRGAARLPIRELLGPRPVDVLLHDDEAQEVGARGQTSLAATFMRLLPMEIGKAAAAALANAAKDAAAP